MLAGRSLRTSESRPGKYWVTAASAITVIISDDVLGCQLADMHYDDLLLIAL